jgi:hypothetical protein
MLILSSNDDQYFYNNLSSPCSNENCTNPISSSIPANVFSSSLLMILILSILCFLGVCFMIFGPLQRSEAYKRVENFTFGRNPIFNIDHREQSSATAYDDSMEFSNI